MSAPKEIPRLSVQSTDEEVYRALCTAGCVIVEQLAPPDLIQRINTEVAPFIENEQPKQDPQASRKTMRFGSVLLKSPSTQALVAHPIVTSMLDRVLLPACQRYQLSSTEVIHLEPGYREEPAHRSDAVYPFPRDGLEIMVTAHWSVSDITEEDSAIQVAPGYLKCSEDHAPSRDAFRAATMLAGSVLLLMGSMWHRACANLSKASRTDVVFSYNVGWLRQAENHYLSIPPEKARMFPGFIQDLLGYRIHEPNLGWVEGQDPSMVLESTLERVLKTNDLFSETMMDAARANSA